MHNVIERSIDYEIRTSYESRILWFESRNLGHPLRLQIGAKELTHSLNLNLPDGSYS